MERENYTNRIDAYLEGTLTADERTAFEEEMQGDSQLAKELKLHKLERRAAQLMLQKEYKEKIKNWRSEAGNEQQTTTTAKTVQLRPLRRTLAIAATILLLLVAGTAIWANLNFSNSSLVADNYLMADTPGDRGSSANAVLDAGLQAFFAKDYEEAILQLQTIQQSSQPFSEAQYYLAHSYLQMGQYDEAIDRFEYVLQLETLPAYLNRDKILWNQVLAYVGKGDFGTEFQQKLDELKANGTPVFKQKAQELEAELNSFWRTVVF